MLAAWQREVLDETEAPSRTNDAHAKAGNERYGLTPSTQADFAACLREATDSELPLAARAARAYLDVAFFHPFTDGNARVALLTLVHVLAREDIVLSEVGPLQITRAADTEAFRHPGRPGRRTCPWPGQHSLPGGPGDNTPAWVRHRGRAAVRRPGDGLPRASPVRRRPRTRGASPRRPPELTCPTGVTGAAVADRPPPSPRSPAARTAVG
ncbi:Fic family protein [Streptomyces longwoodensis]|uniref:Fic family protein n=1 Tax=Streptomyces longwoodensis TaxID=68231 RepID=UPI0037FC801D